MYFIEPSTSALKEQQQLIVAPARWTVSSEGSKNKSFGIAERNQRETKSFGVGNKTQ